MHAFYDFFITLPDRFFPFASKVADKFVYGRTSYDMHVHVCEQKFGPHADYCGKLLFWRELFHLAGSLLFIVVAHGLHKLTGTKTIGYAILGALVLFITFQEFYLHPQFYNQKLFKGIIDWLVWVIPITIYYFLSKN